MPLHRFQFDNGLTLLAEPQPEAHTAAVGFFVRTGSRDEAADEMGVSHFLEHMAFKGTARRSAEAVNRELDELGGHNNAFTSQEITAFFAQVLPGHLPRAIHLLADLLEPTIADEDFEVERRVILEEIEMYEDRPAMRLQDVLFERHYAGHGLGHRILGTPETLAALTPGRLRAYFRERYTPGNIVVAVAGAFDPAAARDAVGEATASWARGTSERAHGAIDPRESRAGLREPELAREYIALLAAAPSAQDPRRHASRVLAEILGDEEGSRLYWALLEPGLAEEAEFAVCPHDRAGSAIAFAAAPPDGADAVERILLETLDDAAREGVTADEVERAKHKLATATTLQGESPMGRMTELGSQGCYLDEPPTLEDELERITAVSADDVGALLEAMPLAPRTVLRLGPAAPDEGGGGA